MMPNLFYPCCEVGDKVSFEKEGPLKSNCWNCGSPAFEYVTNLDTGQYWGYYSFTFNARMVRPTDETPPWRI